MSNISLSLIPYDKKSINTRKKKNKLKLLSTLKISLTCDKLNDASSKIANALLNNTGEAFKFLIQTRLSL